MDGLRSQLIEFRVCGWRLKLVTDSAYELEVMSLALELLSSREVFRFVYWSPRSLAPFIPFTETLLGLTITPRLGLQLKYFLPCTVPSCLPALDFNSSPSQQPSANSTGPIYRKVAKICKVKTALLNSSVKKSIR